jgi:PAS domain S-box-containing protein
MSGKSIIFKKRCWWRRILPLLITYHLSLITSLAQGDSLAAREYTPEHPLIYEEVWDLWPYAFLNDNGEPEGYNVDLVRLVMKRLNIPYVIKLKSSEEVFNDLKEGKSDLTLGLAVGYHDQYGLYGKNAVTLFTQSVVTPKSKPVEIKTFRDLGKPGIKVIVNHTSMCYHLMKDYGWEENAIPMKDIREVIQQVSAKEEGQIVWNTLTLKWLMRRYLIDNLQLTPVNMPHGEYKFMSHDQHLLDMLDEELTKLNANDELKPLQDKWFYPEHLQKDTPKWVIYALVIAGLLLFIMLVYFISYRLQSYRLTRANDKRNRRLAVILQTSQVHIWTYDIAANQFAWRNENGQVAYTYTMEEFSQRYSPEDFAKLKDALDELGSQESGDKSQERNITLNLRAKDTESGDNELRDYVIVLSVLRRDKHGKPTVIIGTKKDVTRDRDKERFEEERTLRYWSIFYTPVVGILLFDKDGYLVNINPKACEIFCCEEDEIINEHVSLRDIFDIGNCTLEETDGYHASQFINFDTTPLDQRKIKSIRRTGRVCNEVRLMTVYDDDNQLLNIFAVVRDVTCSVYGIEQNAVEKARFDAVQAVLQKYNTHIDNVIHESDVRLATYSPATHTLTIHRSVDEIQHAMTQTRCMTLVNDASKKLAMRVLNEMDDCADKNFRANIRTTLRVRGGKQLEVQFCLMPLHDKEGRVVQYLGLLRDLSELRDVERQLDIQTAKVQEVENTKNSFVKNMVQEIRTPMSTVLDYVEQIDPEQMTDNEAALSKGILENADYLLHLIDNILYLSRLQARMVEIIKQPRNFAELFESQCMTGWMKYQNANTRYIVENPYEQLTVDIDAENLGNAIGQIAANAAQHTQSGVVRARYDYIGRRLIISVDDTGEGMPPEVLAEVNRKDTYSTPNTKGLGLAITKELVSQMGGTVEISSELGSGTTVYIMLPCAASVIKRKKQM